MFENLSQQFNVLFDPSTALGAFLISLAASIVASFLLGFFSSKIVFKQKAKNVEGDMMQGNKVTKR